MRYETQFKKITGITATAGVPLTITETFTFSNQIDSIRLFYPEVSKEVGDFYFESYSISGNTLSVVFKKYNDAAAFTDGRIVILATVASY